METRDVEEKNEVPVPPAQGPEKPSPVHVDAETLNALQRVANVFERMRLADYIMYLQSPPRMILMNFLAGLFRGLGLTLGATILVALVVYLLRHMVNLPLIGAYVAKIVRIVQHEIGNKM
jgi:hypothetical protein